MAGYATPSRLQRRGCTSAKNNIMPPHSAHLRCWWGTSMGFKINKYNCFFVFLLYFYSYCLNVQLPVHSAQHMEHFILRITVSSLCREMPMSALQIFLSSSPETAYGTAWIHSIFSFNNIVFVPTAFYRFTCKSTKLGDKTKSSKLQSWASNTSVSVRH